MRLSYIKGVSFGLTSGIITTLGMIVGLQAGTESRLAVIGGVLTIAIADAFSDSLGMHISEESENKHTNREIWESTIGTFAAKFIFAMTFLVPILLFSLSTAIWISIAWGLFWLGFISFWMAHDQKKPVSHVMCEHLGIAIVVIFITHFVGDWILATFGELA
jgi:VIT1/CCC1 family predicted Fe2+/Mn2+ transporter